MTFLLVVSPDGNARCLHTDALPLAALGTLDIRRASNVEFNPDAQLWEVCFADNPAHVVFRHPSRAACIAWEIETLNTQLA